jgi:pyruvate,water dikinase
MIWQLEKLPEQAKIDVGGKARVLAQLSQAGYPVPAGFVIGSEAFENGELGSPAWKRVLDEVTVLRRNNGRSPGKEEASDLALAVRSSAIAEDSTAASFAGEFESILDVKADEQMWQAIHTVYQSRESERVRAYTIAQGLEPHTEADEIGHEMSVIVQEMVPAAYAGVLFTACDTSYPPGHFVVVFRRLNGGFYAQRSQRRTEGQVQAHCT